MAIHASDLAKGPKPGDGMGLPGQQPLAPGAAMTTTLRTERLVLRPEMQEDAARVAALTGDFAVAEMIGGQCFPNFRVAVEGRILINQARAPLGLEYTFAVDLHGEGLIGGAVAFLRGRSGVEIGYWIGRPYWGLGYGAEAAAAVRDFAAALRAGPVMACFSDDNPLSGKVLEKIGFVPTGATERRYSVTRRAAIACIVMRFPGPDGPAAA